ncbi:MAG: M28 family peptidase [Solirubrobacterales bacterium]
MPAAAAIRDQDLAVAMETITELADEIGPRRPTGPGESAAADALVERLRAAGIDARTEEFRGYSTFGAPFGIVLGLAVLPALLPRRLRLSRLLASTLAVAGLLTEGSLRFAPLSSLLARGRSRNVVATIEPAGAAERTICLVAHMDTSRSGLIFHPRVVRWMPRWIAANSILVLVQGVLEPLAGRRPARKLLGAVRGALAGSLGLLAEREVRGVDVPGANDNASGCGVVAALASRLAEEPLAATRVKVLITGCEESGTLGAQAHRDSHETGEWLFLNFDNVGGPGTVRFLRREGVIAKWDADPGMIAAAQGVADRRPDLRMAPTDDPAGLTYDSSPIHAAGGRALTISVQDGFIPDLHWPTDTVANVDRDGVRRTLEAGAELVGAIDRGEAD